MKNSKKMLTLRGKILIAMVFLTLFSTLTVAMANWFAYKNSIEQNYRSTYRSHLHTFNSMIDDKLADMNDLVRSVFLSDEFLNLLKLPNETGSKYYSSGTELQISKIFQKMSAQSSLVRGLAIFDETGRYSFWMTSTVAAREYLDYYTGKDCTAEDWYQTADASEGLEVYFGYNVLSPDSSSNRISLVKEIKDLQTREKLGMLVILLDESFLSTTLLGSQTDFASDTLMILDEKSPDMLIYCTDEAYAGDMLPAYLNENTQHIYLFTDCENLTTGWKIVNGVIATELSKESSYLQTTIFAVAALTLFVCVVVSNLLSRKLYRPLRQLDRVLGQVREGSRHITETFDDSEIGVIGNTLKETVNNNIELKERLLSLRLKERESELMLLQAQINPHFLYNTLDSIYCKAEIENEKDIAAMVGALSDLFKISLSKGNREIPVSEEIDYIQKYMLIQNLRYENRFELILEVDEDIMDLHIIKLILEPFVENAVQHGLEGKIGNGFIEIKGERIGNDIYFSVTDNGIGMEDTGILYTGYGVKNVVDRIHLFYGEEYGISVASTGGQGTRIDIRVPIMEGEHRTYDESGCD